MSSEKRRHLGPQMLHATGESQICLRPNLEFKQEHPRSVGSDVSVGDFEFPPKFLCEKVLGHRKCSFGHYLVHDDEALSFGGKFKSLCITGLPGPTTCAMAMQSIRIAVHRPYPSGRHSPMSITPQFWNSCLCPIVSLSQTNVGTNGTTPSIRLLCFPRAMPKEEASRLTPNVRSHPGVVALT